MERLGEEKIPSPQGKETWCKKAVETVLSNIKYTGNAKILNHDPNGRSYVLENSHPAIIAEDKYDRVQEEITKRAKRKRRNERITIAQIQEISWPVSQSGERKKIPLIRKEINLLVSDEEKKD